ncbi:5-hydroxytryptamine receptor 1B-like [Menidia menidia]
MAAACCRTLSPGGRLRIRAAARDKRSLRPPPTDPSAPPPAVRAALAVTLALVTAATALSNAFVIAAIRRARRLRTPPNLLIASLALADLLVSVLVMPLGALQAVRGGAWPLGRALCDLWLASDVTCCTASILHLCVIALDRYRAVTDPVRYPGTRTRARAAAMVAGAWGLAACISLPPFLWRHAHPEGEEEEEGAAGARTRTRSCRVSSEHLFYTLFSTLGAFYLPTLLLLALYGRIYAEARKRIFRRVRVHEGPQKKTPTTHGKRLTCARLMGVSGPPTTQASPSVSTSSQNYVTGEATPPQGACQVGACQVEKKRVTCARLMGVSGPPPTHSSPSTSISSTSYITGEATPPQSACACQVDVSSSHVTGEATPPPPQAPPGVCQVDVCVSDALLEKKRVSAARERRATRTLGIILGAYIVCWLPFFSYTLLLGACASCLRPRVFDALTWLGYLNSLINPVVYTMANDDFRQAFHQLLPRIGHAPSSR